MIGIGVFLVLLGAAWVGTEKYHENDELERLGEALMGLGLVLLGLGLVLYVGGALMAQL